MVTGTTQNKKSDRTKTEIIRAATDLFARNGYEYTTIEDILREWGGSKGSLYYYFKSKEEILDAVVQTLVENEEERIRDILSENEFGTLEMLNLFLAACLGRNRQLYGLEAEIYRSRNITLSYRIAKMYIERSILLLEPIIRKGVDEGFFKTDHPAETIEFALIVEEFVFKYPMFECGDEQYLRKISAYQSLLENMLGLERGSLDQLSDFCEIIKNNQRRGIHDKV
ncbi:putative DNA-binding transcriptional regulator [Candidatus Methanoplasma termitum]|uniref:Putative DNA-binding transcriptional regulator n=1 Tax=Candidatus Methanoplasma termitum TaxID=1577791 RepID=A0A0A7LBJ8_9ARCH|nr:TetR/AcrR family transcriptional regulator [Candidatus Methanoplasma termitum]AIZ56393.1 putative DNA-binding transcriptional regulator [Candidatus Methanoplasma termitum]MCL2333707.1 TetR/AcrR family transcriptional regulator [Candidatus Methanoplasma sp.]